MNKFAAIAILALAAVASAQFEEENAEMSLITSDADETSMLTDSTKGFADFCLTTRDFIVQDIKTNTNNQASKAFNTFFATIGGAGARVLADQNRAASTLSDMIRNPTGAPINVENPVDAAIAEGQKNIAASTGFQPTSVLRALGAEFNVVKTSLTAIIQENIEKVKQTLAALSTVEALEGACDLVKKYDVQLREDFEQARQGLGSSAKYEDVNCVTAKRIAKLDGICGFALAIKDPLRRVMNSRMQQ